MDSTAEKRVKHHHYVPGFGDLADFITSDHDHATAVYKRFEKLASRDLLYYQSELSRLEACQDRLDIQDRKEFDDKRANAQQRGDILKIARDWDTLRESHMGEPQSDLEKRSHERMKLAMEIRMTLKEYRKALIQESHLLSFGRPSMPTMKAVSHYFNHYVDADAQPYPNHTVLTGDSSGLYPRNMSTSQFQASDYVILRPSDGSEHLTQFLKRYCWWLFRIEQSPPLLRYRTDTISHLPLHQIRHYSDERIRLVASFITTLTTASLLIAPIYTLYHTAASKPAVTLGLIVLFTFVFAGAIVVMTQARRAEVFGACAAYAAVLVVFVSGDFVGGSKGT
ncbi:hypothetical protein PG990_008171 [Apiospora arundinis]|uniref:Chorismate mutase protein n=1 Tax=Apiospora arundinis TaxID=335852 RepID=A0ABR2JMU9_9PEZI